LKDRRIEFKINAKDVSWWESLEKIQTLAARSNANIVFGHDYDVFAEYTKQIL
jgi:glyoxylase-like metal-dependent hydrolase (beta-lactamase superfamily II)